MLQSTHTHTQCGYKHTLADVTDKLTHDRHTSSHRDQHQPPVKPLSSLHTDQTSSEGKTCFFLTLKSIG